MRAREARRVCEERGLCLKSEVCVRSREEGVRLLQRSPLDLSMPSGPAPDPLWTPSGPPL
eukprot:2422159-Pyramimonas_sp.AAC.2